MIPKTSLLWYGIYSQGKTLMVGQLADWVAKVSGGQLTTRLYSADGGGDAPVMDKLRVAWTSAGQSAQGTALWTKREVNPKGVLDALHMGDAPFRFEYMDQITRGWWPNAEGKLVPPTKEDLALVGGRVYEGLTSYCEAMNQTLSEKVENGQIKVDPKAISKFERPAAHFQDGTSMVADIPPGLYKLIYQRIKRYVNQSQGLPGINAWTAKELQVEDKDTKAKQYGPLLVGSKETVQAPGWFQHTLHLTTAQGARLVVDAKGNKRQVARVAYRVHLKQYFDPDMPTVPYLCGLRLPASVNADEVPGFLEDQSEDGRPWSKQNPFDVIMPLIGLG